MGLSADEAAADARIVPTILQAVRTVPFGILEPPPRLAMLTGRRRITGKQRGRPGTVMRLQA